jgi:hypothetical protein
MCIFFPLSSMKKSLGWRMAARSFGFANTC